MLPENEREKKLSEYWRDRGLEHSEPSPETKKMFNTMQDDITQIKIHQEGINKDITHIKDSVSEIKDGFKEFTSKVESNYATKKGLEAEIKVRESLESNLKKTVGTVILMLISSLIYFIKGILDKLI